MNDTDTISAERKALDRLARRVEELEAALEVLARWPLEKTRFEAERFAKEALRR